MSVARWKFPACEYGEHDACESSVDDGRDGSGGFYVCECECHDSDAEQRPCSICGSDPSEHNWEAHAQEGRW
jgi:hypothetical protein